MATDLRIRRKIHRLTDPQKMAMLDAFRAFHPAAVEERLIAEEVAERLTKSLGFTVTRPHVHHACTALKLELVNSHGPRQPVEQTVIEQVNQQFADLRQQLQTVRAEVGGYDRRYFSLEQRLTNAIDAQQKLAERIDKLLAVADRLDRLEKALGGSA